MGLFDRLFMGGYYLVVKESALYQGASLAFLQLLS